MALRTVLTDDNPALRKVCRPYTEFNSRLHELLDDMKETLIKENGVGIAAPQVGILRRIALVDLGEEIVELINPEIIETEGEQEEVEGCLSVPDVWGVTRRPAYVKVKAMNRNGEEFTVEGEGLNARCLCHEIDHLDGHLFTDNVLHILSPEEVEEMMED